MRELIFYQLDVFTRTAFQGNALAVFPEEVNLTDEEMQAIAREMNLSETVFVQASERALKKLRIFTPKQELPLAGHPVVGTWNLLAALGVVPQAESGVVEISQELKVGVLPVEIEFQNGEPRRVTMTQGAFEAGSVMRDEQEIAGLAAALGLSPADFNYSPELPVQTVSTGIKSLAVPVKSLDALGRIKVNSSRLSDIYLAFGAIGCYAFTFQTREETSDVHARFFAPADSIAEDPATGSAAGALAGYLTYHGALETKKLTIEQGDFMQRPSRIFAEVAGERGRVEKVKIGGNSVIVAKGELFF